MSRIDLEDGNINYEGEWLSAEDLAKKIQEKISEGDLKVASLAASLEELTIALENSQTLEIRTVLPKEEYETLKTLGGEDDRECIRKAILSFIASEEQPDTATGTIEVKKEEENMVVKCIKCDTPIEISSDERPIEVECPFCGTSRVLE